MKSLFARDHGLRLHSESDALDVLSIGLPACIFFVDDLHREFFDLSNGVAGGIFQKFVNYRFRVAFIMGDMQQRNQRVKELMIDHKNHPYIRFFANAEDATTWLT